MAERPNRGPITEKTFNLETAKIEALKDGQILVKVLYTSIVSVAFWMTADCLVGSMNDMKRRQARQEANEQDPTMRNWLNAARSYMRPIDIGEPMRAAGIGRVVGSKSKKFAPGDLVRCYLLFLEAGLMG